MIHLEKEINEQPQAVQRLLDLEHDNVAAIGEAIRAFDPTFVHIAARGTSDNAARYGQYLMGTFADLAVSLATPSVHTLYGGKPKIGKALTIGISQSGKAEDVRRVLADAKAQGGLTLAITNDPESPLAKEADHHIYQHAGPEVSIAATKTYTTQLTAVAMLTAAISQSEDLLNQLENVPEHITSTLMNSTDIKDWAQRYRYAQHIIAVGRGYNYATSFEVALKIKELCYTTGGGYSEADFRHGPIAMVGNGFPVVVIAPEGKALPNMVSLLEELKKREAETIVFSNHDTALKLSTRYVALPKHIPECLSPISAVVPGQILGLWLAMSKGYEVDKPRGLSKVTVTV